MALYADITKHVEWTYTARVPLPDDASDDPDDHDAEALAEGVADDAWNDQGGDTTYEIDSIDDDGEDADDAEA